MDKICYTAIFSDYDTLHDPRVISEGWEYICYTDQDFKSDVYEIIKIDGDRMKSRELKTIPHKYFDYDKVVWHDGSFTVNCDLNKLADTFLVQHPLHNCAYKEIDLCLKLKKDSRKNLLKSRQELERLKWPKENGCYANGLMGRVNSKVQNRFNEAWYSMLQEFTIRDQVFSPYLLDGFGLNPHIYTWAQAIDLFFWHKHNYRK